MWEDLLLFACANLGLFYVIVLGTQSVRDVMETNNNNMVCII